VRSEPPDPVETVVNTSSEPADPKARIVDEEATITAFAREDQKVLDWILSHADEVIRERKRFLEQLQKKRCNYGGGTLPITLVPLFLKKQSLKLLSEVGVQLDKILDKVVLAYFQDPEVRSYFPYPDIPVEWISWDPGYKKPTVLSRHDALFDGKNLKFIEFNCDNPGGRGWHDTYDELLRNSPIHKDLITGWGKPSEREMLEALKNSLLKCYQEYGGTKKNPRVALVSFKQFLAGSDNEIVRDYLIEHGIEANFVDARDFEYRKGGLYSNNVRFDIVNLCLRFTFFKRFPREMRDFLEAIRDRAVCCVNPLRAILGSQKEAMSFITNEQNHHFFNKEEVECIQKYVPWTRKMDETITFSKEGTDISLQEYVLKHKDELVLKPTDGAGGHGVYVGKETDKGAWSEVIENCMGCPWWIIQEAVEIPVIDLPIIKEKKIVMEKRHFNLNPYIFDGNYAGCLGRVSSSKVINVSSGGGIIPIFPLK
jgi:glutathionylspermidine synthase